MPRHLLETLGGTRSACIFSGAVAPGLGGAPGAVAVGADVLFFSGAGRLAGVVLHQSLLSGLGITFYDSHAPVSGGPLSTSGHIIVGAIPSLINTPSGSIVPLPVGLIPMGVPFFSGLCVNSRSGQAGYTVTWTPEANPDRQ